MVAKMAVKRLITPYQHIKKCTFSEKETFRPIINNGYACFVNNGKIVNRMFRVFSQS